ncbi:MAG: hypothetical protein V4717_15955 [Bacteroidota bacterium]
MLSYYSQSYKPASISSRHSRLLLPAMLLLAIMFSLHASAQPNITRVEYYIDSDPGYGNATPLTIPGNTNVIANATIPINPATISEGVHRLYVRAKSSNGWSMTNKWLFYKPYGGGVSIPPLPPAPNITRIEYYFDTDPGFGNATPLPAAAATNLADLIIPVDTTNMSEGVHRLYVRAKSANGWSLTNKWLFYKPYGNGVSEPATPAPNLSALEYYIDTDPGIGNGVPVAIEPVKQIADAQLFINITGLPTGEHHLYLRGKDSTGSWSLVNDKLFNITAAQASPSLIVNSISRNTLCARDSFSIGYHVAGTYNAGNTFKAFLSDATGSFTNETEIGTIISTKSGLITCRLPSHLPGGTGYKLRIKSSNSVLIGATSNGTLTIRERPNAQTISGHTLVNGTYTWPYAVSNVITSIYNWQISGGIKAGGANTNSITTTWNQPATDSINGFVRNIETNQYGCVGDTSKLSPITIYKLDIGDTVVAAVCKGNTLVVKTGTTGWFDAGNNLVAELSNASGSFTTPTATVTKAYTGNGVNKLNSFDLPIPAGLPNGTGYRVRIRSTNPAFTGDTTSAISIIKPGIGIDRNVTYCDGYGYNLKQHYTDNTLVYGYFSNTFVLLARPDSIQAGSYRVIGTNSIGCSDTAIVTVTSNPSPALGADTSIYHTCPGEFTNLTLLYITTGLTVNWNTGNTASAPPGNYRLVVTNNVGCTDTAFAKVVLETATWTGATSNNWHTASNWSTGKVPSLKTHVIIAAGTPNPCVLKDTNGVAASIQVNAGGNIQLTNNRTLDIKQKCSSLPLN